MFYIKRMIAVIILFAGLALPVSAQSQDTKLSIIVPSQCFLQTNFIGRGTIFINGKKITNNETVSIRRHEKLVIEVQSGLGHQIAVISLNGIDITHKLHSGKMTIEGISSDSILTVFFAKKNAVWPGSNPPTGDGIVTSVICFGVSLMGLLILEKKKYEQ